MTTNLMLAEQYVVSEYGRAVYSAVRDVIGETPMTLENLDDLCTALEAVKDLKGCVGDVYVELWVQEDPDCTGTQVGIGMNLQWVPLSAEQMIKALCALGASEVFPADPWGAHWAEKQYSGGLKNVGAVLLR